MESQTGPLAVGVDGVRGGWLMAVLNTKQLRYVTSLADLPGPGVIAIDIPLGFPSGPDRRPAEVEAAKMLRPGRSSSLFRTAPKALSKMSIPGASSRQQYAAARERMQRLCEGVSLSAQSYALQGKILEARRTLEVLRSDPENNTRLIKTHPEVVFSTLNDGSPARHSKATWGGHRERV